MREWWNNLAMTWANVEAGHFDIEDWYMSIKMLGLRHVNLAAPLGTISMSIQINLH
jgi:hypothetical protein